MVNWATGTKATWKLERGNESLTLHFFKTTFWPHTRELILSLCSRQRNRKLQREKGAPVSYTMAQGGWGHWGCWLGPFKAERGYSPFFALGGGTWEQGKVVLSWETTKRGSLRVAALKNCTWGSHTLSPTELGRPGLIVYYSFSNTPGSLNETVPSVPRNSSENHPFPAWP